MKRKVNLIFFLTFLMIFIGISNPSFAKDERDLIKKGNSLYKKDKFKDAEVQYRKALEVEPNSNIAKYNLGTSYYRQGNFDQAKESFDAVDNKKFDKKDLADAYYNLGNSQLQAKKYEDCIESYKKALVNNPEDKDAKYNLEYARKMIQQQQQQQNQKNQNNKDDKQQQQQNQQNQNQDKKDQNKDQNKQNQNQDKKDQNKDQNKQNQNQQNQDQNQDKNKQNQDQQQQQQQQPKISKQDAERILQALNNEEKNVQKKVKAKAAVKGKLEKNW